MDRDLVEAARNGDREAYVDLIRVRSDRLFAVAQRILRDIDRAEDALQDALVITKPPPAAVPVLPVVVAPATGSRASPAPVRSPRTGP